MDTNKNGSVTVLIMRKPRQIKKAPCEKCGGPTIVKEVGQLAPHKPFMCCMNTVPMYECTSCNHLFYIPKGNIVWEDENPER